MFFSNSVFMLATRQVIFPFPGKRRGTPVNAGKKKTEKRIRRNILSADFFSDVAKPS